MIFGTEVRIISQTYSEATQLMPTITWAKKKNIENLYNIAGPYLGRRKCAKKHCFPKILLLL